MQSYLIYSLLNKTTAAEYNVFSFVCPTEHELLYAAKLFFLLIRGLSTHELICTIDHDDAQQCQPNVAARIFTLLVKPTAWRICRGRLLGQHVPLIRCRATCALSDGNVAAVVQRADICTGSRFFTLMIIDPQTAEIVEDFSSLTSHWAYNVRSIAELADRTIVCALHQKRYKGNVALDCLLRSPIKTLIRMRAPHSCTGSVSIAPFPFRNPSLVEHQFNSSTLACAAPSGLSSGNRTEEESLFYRNALILADFDGDTVRVVQRVGFHEALSEAVSVKSSISGSDVPDTAAGTSSSSLLVGSPENPAKVSPSGSTGTSRTPSELFEDAKYGAVRVGSYGSGEGSPLDTAASWSAASYPVEVIDPIAVTLSVPQTRSGAVATREPVFTVVSYEASGATDIAVRCEFAEDANEPGPLISMTPKANPYFPHTLADGRKIKYCGIAFVREGVFVVVIEVECKGSSNEVKCLLLRLNPDTNRYDFVPLVRQQSSLLLDSDLYGCSYSLERRYCTVGDDASGGHPGFVCVCVAI